MAVCIPKTVGAHFIKPRSALAYPLALIRIFSRWGVSMPGFKTLKTQLDGLMRQYLAYHGPHSLAPKRAEPMKFSMVNDINNIPLDTGITINGLAWNENNHDVFMFRALSLFMIVTAFRLGEIVMHASMTVMYITRACVYVVIDGMIHFKPTISQLRSMRNRRDKVCIIPPCSKSDQFGEIHCPFPVSLTLDEAPDNAARALIEILIRCPCPDEERDTRPLFADASGRPYTHARLDTLLRAVLTFLYGARVASLYTWHSYRSGLATALHAAGVSDAMIQLICRWMCPESLLVYRRMGTVENERNVAAARRMPVDSLQSANAPRVAADEGYASLLRDITGPRVTRALDVDFDHARTPQPRRPQPVAAVPQQDAQAPATGRVLVPAELWPDFPCHENNGRGWEAEIRSVTGLTALVRFVHERAPDGRPYRDERLPRDRLLPL